MPFQLEVILTLSPGLETFLRALAGAVAGGRSEVNVAAAPRAVAAAPPPPPGEASGPSVDAPAAAAPPRAAPPVPASRVPIFTPERRALLKLLWPSPMPSKEICERLRALPGRSIDDKRIGVFAAYMKLKRPPRALVNSGIRELAPAAAPVVPPPPPARQPSEPRPLAAATPREHSDLPADSSAADPPIPASRDAPLSLPLWTPERIRVLRRDYGRVSDKALLARLAALPGPPVTMAWMHGYAEATLKPKAATFAPASHDTPPRSGDRATIIAWAESKGWAVHPFDLAAINRRCHDLGIPRWIEVDRPGARAVA